MSTKEKNKDKSSSVTVADLIVIIAFVIFAVFSYFGLVIQQNSANGTILVYLAGYIFLLVLLISFLKYIKRVENDFKRWRIVEAVFLFVFVLSFFLTSKPLILGLAATFNQRELKEVGLESVKEIRDLYSKYESIEEDNINTTISSIKNLVNSSCNASTKTILKYTTGQDYVNDQSVARYSNILRKKYLGDSGDGVFNYDELKTTAFESLLKAENDISNWNFVSLATVPSTLSEILRMSKTRLTNISSQKKEVDGKSYPFKYVFVNQGGVYVLDNLNTEGLCRDYNKENIELKFGEKISSAKSPVAYAIALIIYLFMLLSYFSASRSTTVDIRRTSKNGYNEDGGISLYE